MISSQMALISFGAVKSNMGSAPDGAPDSNDGPIA